MLVTIAPNHPNQRLLFFVAKDVDEPARTKVRDFVLGLASLRHWLNGPPSFVDSPQKPEIRPAVIWQEKHWVATLRFIPRARPGGYPGKLTFSTWMKLWLS